MKLIPTLALAALLLPALPTFAQTTPAPTPPATSSRKAAKTPKVRGKITAATATSITVDSKKEGSKTFSIGPATMIMVDGKAATASDITVGRNATVGSDDGTTALSITVHARKGKKSETPAAVIVPAAPAAPVTPAVPPATSPAK